MRPETKKQLKARLDCLRDALADCDHPDVGMGELVALYAIARDIQPGLCRAIAELSDNPNWEEAYKATVMSDEEQESTGFSLWEEEEEEAG